MSDFKQSSAGYLANHMARLFANRLHRRIRPLGLSPARFPVLLELWEQDGLTQSQLVQRLGVEQATMANTLARMERDGLVERRPSTTDRRARLVYLTDKARGLQADAVAAAQAENRQALSALSEAEQAQFLDLMRRVIAAMHAQ